MSEFEVAQGVRPAGMNGMTGRYLTIEEARRVGESVLVAMSGGVDSAVTALLLVRAGFRAVGLTMKNYCYGDVDVPDRSCCSVEAIGDARRECERLGISHRVVNAEERFNEEVIRDFLQEYENGRTPNPCVRCNSIVRFDTLVEHADRLGLDYVATGHYARVFASDDGRRFLARARNREKDQSYFLSGVHGATLDRVIFPLGDFVSKDGVRDEAAAVAMDVATKRDSQEVCFVPEGTLRAFLESREVPMEPGPIENTRGEVVGSHEGLAAYTVGQRRGLGFAAGVPQYVIALDARRNVLVVGQAEDLLRSGLECTFRWYDDVALRRVPRVSEPLVAQIRYRHGGALVRAVEVDGVRGRIHFAEPQRAVSPGQTVALYDGDHVVASGVIDAGIER